MHWPRFRDRRFYVAALTENQRAELVPANFRGTNDDDIGGQALLVLGTLAERAERLRDPLTQGVVGNHDLHGAPGDACFQPRQPGQLGRGDDWTPGAREHGLQNDLLQLFFQWNLF